MLRKGVSSANTAFAADMDEDIDTEDEDHTNWREPTDFQRLDIALNEPKIGSYIPPISQCNSWDYSSIRHEITTTRFEKERPTDHHRCIVHIDFDCFYCQVEAIRNPSLKGRPFGVYQKQVVVSSNYEARRLGVKKMSTRAEALKACPEMIMVNGEDLTVYREFSMKMFNTLKTFSPFVERVGFDENFIDVTQKIDHMILKPDEHHVIAGHCFGYTERTDMSLDDIVRMENRNACQCGCFLRLALTSILAAKMRKLLYTELGLTSSAGIAHCKVLAKLIGKTHKPNQQTTILPTYAEEFLSCKEVREIPGIGSRCSKELNKMGVETVNQLASVPKKELIERFGARLGNFLIEISLAIDNSVVNVSSDVPKSISEEESFRKLSDFDDVKIQMKILIKKLIQRLEKDGRAPRTIKLSVRKHNMQNNFARVSRQGHFDPKILKSDSKEIMQNTILENVVALFDRMIDDRKSFNLAVINIGFTNFDEINLSSISKFFSKEYSRGQTQATTSHIQYNLEGQEIFDCTSPNKRNFSYPKGEAGAGNEKADTRYGKVPIFKAGCGVRSTTASKDMQKINATDSKDQNPNDLNSSLSTSRDIIGILSNEQDSLPMSSSANCPSEKVAEAVDKQILGRKVTHPDMAMSSVSSYDALDACAVQQAVEKCSNWTENASLARQKEDTYCPTGVDSSVFQELPVEIQKELMQNWKRKEHEVMTINRITPPKKKQKKAAASSQSNSILSYFIK